MDMVSVSVSGMSASIRSTSGTGCVPMVVGPRFIGLPSALTSHTCRLVGVRAYRTAGERVHRFDDFTPTEETRVMSNGNRNKPAATVMISKQRLAVLQRELQKARSLVAELEAAKAAGKPWYKSKGVIAGGIGSLIGIAGLFGFTIEVSPEDQVVVAQGFLAIVGALGVLFRLVAKTKVTK